MLTKETVERITGILFLVVVPLIIVTAVTDSGVDTRVDEFRGSLEDVADEETRGFVHAAFGFLMSSLVATTGAAVYVMFRPYDRFLSVLGAFGFLAAGVAFMMTIAAGLAFTELASEFADTSGVEADQIVPAARALALATGWFLLSGFVFLGLGLLALGILIAWRRPLPGWLGWLAAVSGVLMAVGGPTWFLLILGLFLSFVWFIVAGGRLVWRGTNETGAAGSGPA